MDQDDILEGCSAVELSGDYVDDKDLEGWVLFAGVAPEDVEAKKAEWEEIFRGP